MSARVDWQATVLARWTAAGEHRVRLLGEVAYLLWRDPDACHPQLGGGRFAGLLRPRLSLAGDDHEPAPALVITKSEFTYLPAWLAHCGILGRPERACLRRTQLLVLEELTRARDQSLNVELLASEDQVLRAGAGEEEEPPPAGLAGGRGGQCLDFFELEILRQRSLIVPDRLADP